MKEKAKAYFLDHYNTGATTGGGASGMSSLGSGLGKGNTNQGILKLPEGYHDESIQRAKSWLSKKLNK